MSVESVERLEAVVRFFQVKEDSFAKAQEALAGMQVFLVFVPGTEVSFLAPDEGFDACEEHVISFHDERYIVFRIVAQFGSTSRGLIARAAGLLADGGLRMLNFCGGEGVYFAVLENHADKADRILKTLIGPIPGSGEHQPYSN
jgi:hypothetical protein